MKKLANCLLELLLFALLIFLWRVAHYEYYQPTRNSHPNKFITIKGYVAANLRQHVRLAWQGVYQTSVPACEKVESYLEGVSFPRAKTVNFNAVLDAQGKFMLKIPYNYFKFGHCGWQLGKIEDNSRYYDRSGAVSQLLFEPAGTKEDQDIAEYKLAKHYRKHAYYHLVCSNKKCRLLNNYIDFTGYDALPRVGGLLMTVLVTDKVKTEQ